MKILTTSLFAGFAAACTCNSSNFCTDIPSDFMYYLQTQCTTGGISTVCGAFTPNCSVDNDSNGAQRFGCTSSSNTNYLNCTYNKKTLLLKIIMNGPTCDVETSVGGPVVSITSNAC